VSGQGLGTTLQIASERRAYTISDRATFGVLDGIVDLVPLVQGHAALVNRYSAILPTASAHPVEASTLIRWLTSETGRRAIADFRRDRTGVPLFSPAVSGAPDPEPENTPRAGTDSASTQDASPPAVTPPP
jgi:tungstate transport system substrate-binding protein